MPRTLVFCHANGFPAGTYRTLFERWRAAGWHVLAPEKFGHDPRYPVSSNWPHLRDELVDFIRVHTAGRPVYLVGHSLGGYLALLAACHRPDLTRGVVLLDSPVVGGWRAHSIQVVKATGLIGRVSPGKVSKTRRERWPSRDAALAHFAAKPVFARWAPGVLADYIAAGTEPAPEGGVQLAFRRNVETHIYNSLPHVFDRVLHRHPPQCPVAFIGGTQSTEVRQVGLATTRAVTRGRLRWIEGSHLFPMEQPLVTADAVNAELQSMLEEKTP
ncbi:MAG: alpha/beta hydrolase [Burkholderiaceae bacterium]|nr:alpha/beta hydrolase [Rhodoferax sp.]MCP5283527.1 alpha/beta hydrolase [Burkholderiaceae bacterium]